MPLESLTCTHCGSSEVSEYKPGSFVCSHCDGVFKHVDLGSGSGAPELAFCECGDRIEYRCSVCGSGVCAKHEWLAQQGERWRATVAHAALSTRFPTGYRLCAACAEQMDPLAYELFTECSYSVVLRSVGPQLISVLAAIRALPPHVGLEGAREIARDVPRSIREGINKEEAELIRATFEQLGATVEVR